jgi:zinc/manganese transport system ATP-binding protein
MGHFRKESYMQNIDFIVRCDNVNVSYSNHVSVLNDFSYNFIPGCATAIIGNNGCGKTTLLRSIVGDVKLNSGSIVYENCSMEDVAYMPQQSVISTDISFTVLDLVLSGAYRQIGLFIEPADELCLLARQALDDVGMLDIMYVDISKLSCGQLQLVLFARIIFQNTRIIILDEPFNAVDHEHSIMILSVIQRWKKCGRIVIAVMHNMEYLHKYFDCDVALEKGRLYGK